MKQINEYLKPIGNKTSIIKATDDTIYNIVRNELKRVGPDADLNHIDVSEVTTMEALFENTGFCGDVNKWNVGKLQNATKMFSGCKDFNSDISRWDVRNLIFAKGMFSGCENFNRDLSDWRVDSIQNMEHMFFKCFKFNSDLSEWNVSSCKIFSGAFYMCENFSCDLSGWTFAEKPDFYAMFYKCKKLDFNMKNTYWEDTINKMYYSGDYDYMIFKAGFKDQHLPANMIQMKKYK